MVTGSTIIPLSDRFTLSISPACCRSTGCGAQCRCRPLRHRNRHARLGHRVHRGRHQRSIQRDMRVSCVCVLTCAGTPRCRQAPAARRQKSGLPKQGSKSCGSNDSIPCIPKVVERDRPQWNKYPIRCIEGISSLVDKKWCEVILEFCRSLRRLFGEDWAPS